MKKNARIIILFSLAIITWGIASVFRFLITSDIPVTYATSEAITVHTLFSLATLLFLLASSTFSSNKPRIMMGIIFFVLFIFNLSIIKNYQMNAEYYNTSFAQLAVSSLISIGIIMLFNFYFVFRGDKQNPSSSNKG